VSDYYILDGHKTVRVGSMAWAEWFEKSGDRRVAKEKIGEAEISTVFLGIDHSFGQGPPMLFETMVFGGALDQEQDRCTTWEEAEAMHAMMCERVREDAEPSNL
jgi:hypothetical protein